MTKIKIAESGYSVIENEIFRNPKISARAKGIYAYFRTCSPEWEIRLTSLPQFFKEGRDAIKKAMAELEFEGYIKREKYRALDGNFYWKLIVYPKAQFSTIDGKSGDGKSGDGKSGDGKSGDIINTKNKYQKPSSPSPSKTAGKKTPEKNGLKPLGKVKENLNDFLFLFPDRSPTAENSVRELAAIVEETLEREAMTREELLNALRDCRAIQDTWTADNLGYKRGLKSILKNDLWKDRDFWESRVDPKKRQAARAEERDNAVDQHKAKMNAIVEQFIKRAEAGEDPGDLETELYRRGIPHMYISNFTSAVKERQAA